MSRMDVPLSIRSQFREGTKNKCVHCNSSMITFSYIRNICTFNCMTCGAKEVISDEELRKSVPKVMPAALIRIGE